MPAVFGEIGSTRSLLSKLRLKFYFIIVWFILENFHSTHRLDRENIDQRNSTSFQITLGAQWHSWRIILRNIVIGQKRHFISYIILIKLFWIFQRSFRSFAIEKVLKINNESMITSVIPEKNGIGSYDELMDVIIVVHYLAVQP